VQEGCEMEPTARSPQRAQRSQRSQRTEFNSPYGDDLCTTNVRSLLGTQRFRRRGMTNNQGPMTIQCPRLNDQCRRSTPTRAAWPWRDAQGIGYLVIGHLLVIGTWGLAHFALTFGCGRLAANGSSGTSAVDSHAVARNDMGNDIHGLPRAK